MPWLYVVVKVMGFCFSLFRLKFHVDRFGIRAQIFVITILNTIAQPDG